MFFVLIIIFLILVLYILLIISYTFGWHKIKEVSKSSILLKVSVLISIRNEENHIERLLNNLQSQIYPNDKIEFILVNDHSTDNTLSLLEKSSLQNLKVLNMPKNKFGKKNAIMMAVSIADGDIILASDADCSFSPNWVQTMVSYFINDNVKLVSGPVNFHKKKGGGQALQALEFISLIGSGAGAIGIQNAIFCNGANMAYRKDVFLQVNSFKRENVVSGDDVFLLHDIKAKYANSIFFAKDKNAIVMTESTKTIRQFVNQRKRWVAKASVYKDMDSIYSSYLVFLANLSFVFLFTILFFNFSFFQFFLLFYVIKFITDLFLLYPTLKFLSREDLVKWIFPFELFYSFYIILIVVLSFSKKFEWKGRMHKK